MSKATWNQRVIRHKDGKLDFYQIHEVHYEDGKPVAVTEKGTAACGSSVDEVRADLHRMIRCLSLPVLDFDIFERKPPG